MKKILLLQSILLISSLEVDAITRCNRIPEETLKPKNTDGIKYTIEISEDPSSYVAGETYTGKNKN